MLSKRIHNISPSQTLAVNTRAKELAAEGNKIYNFSVGEPDIQPPDILLEEITNAYNDKYTKYTNQIGDPDARTKIATYINKLNQTNYTKENIALTSGGKQALFHVFQSIINQGDEVMVIKPFWVSYEEQIKLAGGVPVFVNSQKNFDLDINEIKNNISEKTKAIVINSPSNPTSQIISQEKIDALTKLLAQPEHQHILIISDDVYQTLSYSGNVPHILGQDKSLFERTIIIQSFSKSLSMTGLRLGVVAASKKIIDGISLLQGHASGNPTSIIQIAAANILDKVDVYQKQYLELFKKRKELASKLLSEIPHISFIEPAGAFYFFIDISKISSNSMKFTQDLLEKKHVALVPGVAFGAEGFVRLSFAASEKNLTEGITLLHEFCKDLHAQT